MREQRCRRAKPVNSYVVTRSNLSAPGEQNGQPERHYYVFTLMHPPRIQDSGSKIHDVGGPTWSPGLILAATPAGGSTSTGLAATSAGFGSAREGLRLATPTPALDLFRLFNETALDHGDGQGNQDD
ncbi:GD20224 [Drosophila simulans]|uniref:GD20224 n=1 Tax=Drosophila simulans TaxID=7240 RepID=B4QVN8_DROSI|nr:GD20224 [Drosophila simulans]